MMLIPFGKHKGQPITTLLNDRDYAEQQCRSKPMALLYPEFMEALRVLLEHEDLSGSQKPESSRLDERTMCLKRIEPLETERDRVYKAMGYDGFVMDKAELSVADLKDHCGRLESDRPRMLQEYDTFLRKKPHDSA